MCLAYSLAVEPQPAVRLCDDVMCHKPNDVSPLTLLACGHRLHSRCLAVREGVCKPCNTLREDLLFSNSQKWNDYLDRPFVDGDLQKEDEDLDDEDLIDVAEEEEESIQESSQKYDLAHEWSVLKACI